jgi:non-heme Fe2+,alpha-ketoglutarate-dependent halogenase
VHTRTHNRHREAFERDGVVFPIDALSPVEIAGVRAAFDEVESVVGREAAQIGLVGKEREYAFLWNAATHPRILDAVESVLGPNLLLLGTHAFCKYPAAEMGKESFVAWHQDATYWGLEPPRVVTAWLAIDDVDEENGAMVVVAGSHTRGFYEHGKSEQEGNLLSVNQAIPESDLDMSRARLIEMKAGQISLHDGLAVHGSRPNRSTRRRCGLTCRFAPPEIRVVAEANRKFEWQAVLVRGEDRCENITLLPAPEFKNGNDYSGDSIVTGAQP